MSINVLFIAAEMSPLVKVGGLGDVAGSLPRALRTHGVDVRVALPRYASIDYGTTQPARIAPDGNIWRADVAGVPVYLVDHAPSFDRPDIYGYDDDAVRFLSFCDELLSSADALEWQPDVLHVNDWHPGFLYTRLTANASHPWSFLPRVHTIHNLGWTGPFDEPFVREHGIAETALTAPPEVEPDVPYSGLAQGILHADLITTVSPTYAREILTPELGWGLAPLLQRRQDRLSGILNGIDMDEFDPAADALLAAQFDLNQIDRRVENKQALQRSVGLPTADVPLLGMVSRLFWQKGPDLAAEAVDTLLATHDVQFVALGQGDEVNEQPLRELAARHPEHVAARFEFSPELAALIYGGCDMFLMPSRYEPCGLGQFIAMRYGAVPIVRRTGGLADSVAPYDVHANSGTGFLFDDPSAVALAATVEEALAVYRNRPDWRQLQCRGMAQDWSWKRAAGQYVELYKRAIDLRSDRAEEGS